MASKPGQPMSDELILEARAAVARHGSISAAAEALGLPRKTLADRAKAKTTKDGERPFPVPKERPQPSFVTGPSFEIVSRKDNTFVFGAAGDLHAGSKYTRWDVREDRKSTRLNSSHVR